jgi:hypothetical protein
MTKKEVKKMLQNICDNWWEILYAEKYERGELEWTIIEKVGTELISSFEAAIDAEEEEEEE